MKSKKMVYCQDGKRISPMQYGLLSGVHGCAHYASDKCDCECHGSKKKAVKSKCVVCGKNTLVGSGWHLKGGLNFCGDACTAEFIEKEIPRIYKIVMKQEKRIQKLERKAGIKA